MIGNKIIGEKRLIHAGHTLTSVHRANFCKCREDTEQKRKETLLEKERERTRRKKKEVKKEELTKIINLVRHWTTKDEVLAGLGNLVTKKAKKDALKLQISFHKKVLC